MWHEACTFWTRKSWTLCSVCRYVRVCVCVCHAPQLTEETVSRIHRYSVDSMTRKSWTLCSVCRYVRVCVCVCHAPQLTEETVSRIHRYKYKRNCLYRVKFEGCGGTFMAATGGRIFFGALLRPPQAAAKVFGRHFYGRLRRPNSC